MIESRSYEGRDQQVKIFIAAGEVSGDRQAAYLAQAILRQQPNAYLFGSGGNKMREAGVDIRIQTSHFGCIGFQESLSYVKPLRKILAELRALLRDDPPDLAILIDNEGFNVLLSKFLHNEGIPFIYYFPPQVWVWGEWRARSIAKRASAIISAFPAEADIYRREGGRVEWFGHPLLDIVKPERDYRTTFRQFGLDPSRPTLGIMPGSRSQELQELTSSMLSAARLVKERYPEMQIIIPLAAPHLLASLEQKVHLAGMTQHVNIISEHVYTCLSRCSLVLVSSGTATLEIALLGIPMVVGYRVKPLTYFLAKRLVNTRFIAMPNILLNQRIVPELLQEDVNAQRFATEAFSILENPERAASIRSHLQHIRSILGTEGVLERAATFILQEAQAVQLLEPINVS